jgi:ribonuclease P protein component
MLPAGHRMRRREEFAAAVRRGERAARGAVVVHVMFRESSHTERPDPCVTEHPHLSRTGFVVSKAVGNAVVRNGVKRRLRHLMRERLDRIPEGALVVVRALPAAATAPAASLGVDLDGALERALGRATARTTRAREHT